MRRLSNFLIFIFVLSVFYGEAGAENNRPTPESIRQIISAANVEWNKFESESFDPRMQFEFSGRLLNEQDKVFFCGLALQ